MRKLVLAALIVAVTATAADARRRHHRHHYYKHAPVMLMMPGAVEAARGERGRIDSPAQLVPRDWQLMPPDPNWQGRRYMAPDGNAWLAFYATNAGNDATARFKAVAFADGEDVTYLRGERDRLTVSGLKGDRIFYRKVMLACGGTIWRHVAMEYPAAREDRCSTVSSSACRAASTASPTIPAATICSPRRSPRMRRRPRRRKRTRSRRRTSAKRGRTSLGHGSCFRLDL